MSKFTVTPSISGGTHLFPVRKLNVPPKYADLGKECKDLLEKDFPYSVKKFEVNTTAPNKVVFTVTGSQDNKSGNHVAELKTKYTHTDTNINLTEKWTTDNVLSAELEANDTLLPGLKLKVESNYQPTTSKSNVKVSTGYLREYLNVNSTVDVLKGPFLSTDVVFGTNGCFLAGEAGYDIQNGSLSQYNLSAAFYRNDYQVVLHGRKQLNEFAASYYHYVSPNVQTGCTATWDRTSTDKNQSVQFEFGSQVRLQADTSAKVKVNTLGHLTMSCTQVLNSSVKGTLAAFLDTKRSDRDACKIGFSLVFNS